MPPRTSLSTPLRTWRCPQCSLRTLSTTTHRAAIGPEHPKYIPFPEPPQQDAGDKTFIKGRLPVPRNIFEGSKGRDKASDEWLAKHTQPPTRARNAQEGSWEQWRDKMSEMRRRNLREGLVSLRARKTFVERKQTARAMQKQAEHAALLAQPEREVDRLTTPSTGLDLPALFKGNLQDPHRAARLQSRRANLATLAAAKRAERLDSLNTLYLAARSFIVTPAQLDTAVDEAFGTPEKPVTFGAGSEHEFGQRKGGSVWALGKPESVQDRLNRATRQAGKRALEGVGAPGEMNGERIRRIAETLTGGKMENGEVGR